MGVRSLLYQAQEQLHQFLRNFPNRPWPRSCAVIFPRGLTYSQQATDWGATSSISS